MLEKAREKNQIYCRVEAAFVRMTLIVFNETLEESMSFKAMYSDIRFYAKLLISI